jgi:hypothetical protein
MVWSVVCCVCVSENMKRDDERKMNGGFTHRNQFEMWTQLHFFSVFTFLFEEHVRDCDQISGPCLCSHTQMPISKI